MTRSVVGLCAGVGLFVGGYLPELWGGSLLSSVLFGVLGGIVGVWVGVRLAG